MDFISSGYISISVGDYKKLATDFLSDYYLSWIKYKLEELEKNNIETIHIFGIDIFSYEKDSYIFLDKDKVFEQYYGTDNIYIHGYIKENFEAIENLNAYDTFFVSTFVISVLKKWNRDIKPVIKKELEKFESNNNTVITENQFWHTLNEPEPEITIYSIGNKAYRWVNEKGQLHRENDLPATIWYNEDGSIRQYWYQNGKRHRNNNLPAEIWYNTDGLIIEESWWHNNKLHRTNGPAIIYYDENGTIDFQIWYLNDEEYTEEGYWKKLKELGRVPFWQEGSHWFKSS